MAAAEELSRLECTEHLPALYTRCSYQHPDSIEQSPKYAVIGWYTTDFQPRGPKRAVATNVTYLDSRTWDVNGVAYPDVAEVSYNQEFADGSTEADVVRLVNVEGMWTRFCGRNAEFVAEQNSRFDQTEQVEESGVAPLGLDGLTVIDPAVLTTMETQGIVLDDGTEAAPQREENAAEM